MDAATLKCPSCGAPAAADATRCHHCASQLAITACPACFGRMFRGSRYCAQCGAAAARREKTATERRCPRCREPLDKVHLGPSVVEECPECSGLWMDTESFERICAAREEQSDVLGMRVLPGAAAPRSLGAQEVRYLRCPECGQVMNRVNFARISGVVVDICKQHGVWFDADELMRIVDFIRGGGLDLARERERQQLEDEQQRLEAERRAAQIGSPLVRPGELYAHPLYFAPEPRAPPSWSWRCAPRRGCCASCAAETTCGRAAMPRSALLRPRRGTGIRHIRAA